MIPPKRSKTRNWRSWRSKLLVLLRGEVEVLLDECHSDGDVTLSVVRRWEGHACIKLRLLYPFFSLFVVPLFSSFFLSKALVVWNYLIVVVATDRLLQPGTLDLRIYAGWPLSPHI